MLRPEMNLPERSEFSSQALLLIRFQILYFSQIPEWNKDPASRISVPFYPGNSEYFPVFLNSSSFRQIRIFSQDTSSIPSIVSYDQSFSDPVRCRCILFSDPWMSQWQILWPKNSRMNNHMFCPDDMNSASATVSAR